MTPTQSRIYLIECNPGHLFSSLRDRRFMSQAGRTRYISRGARHARLGEEENKASSRLVSPRVALRAKYRVRPARLIKRLSSRLFSDGDDDTHQSVRNSVEGIFIVFRKLQFIIIGSRKMST